MDYEWYQLDKRKYKTDVFSENGLGKRFNRLSHQYMLISVASYGGPIALTSDKTKILTLRQDDPSLNNICIFNNEGQLVHRIALIDPFKNIIVCLEFLKDQILLVVYQKGGIWLIDPNTAEIKKLTVVQLLETQIIVKAKVFDNGFAIQTSFRRFLFVRNASQPTLIQFASFESQLKQGGINGLFWRVFSPRSIISQKVQLHCCHPTAGIIQVVEDDGKRIFYNQQKGGHVVQNRLPHLKGIRFISGLSPNNKFICYFAAQPLYKQNPNDQIPQDKKKKQKGVKQPPRQPYAFAYRLIFAPAINSDNLDIGKFKFIQLNFVKSGIHINLDQQPIDIKWCGNRAVIIQFYNQQLYLCSLQGEYMKIEKQRGEKQKWTFLKQQVDGARIITKKDNKILRQIPNAYINVFESFSEHPGSLLRTAFIAYQDAQPLQDDQLRSQKQKLAQGVQQCIASARFQINFQNASQLLRAAVYGKAFLPPNMLDNNEIHETTKSLRICHHLRADVNLFRYITYEQFRQMGDDQLLKVLLRYRQHYLAFQIYNILKKQPTFRLKIYTDWACCRVQNLQQSEEDICDSIRRKLQGQKGISFTQIAHKSIQIGRSQLAMRLLQFQPSLAKKVPLLLWMGNRQQNLETCHKFYQKSISQALRSRDLNLLYLTIKRIVASLKLSEYQIFELFSKNTDGVFALINYYKMFGWVQLIKYYDYLQWNQTKIMQYIRIALASKKYQQMKKLLQSVRQNFQRFQSNLQKQWRVQTFKKLFQNFNQFLSHNASLRTTDQRPKPLTINKQLQAFMMQENRGAVDDIKSQYNIPDKRVILTQIKVLIQKKKFEDLLIFMQKRQKQFSIPAQLVADLLLQKGQATWAMKMLARMPSKKQTEQYLLLKRIGKYKQVIDLAADRKDVDELQNIKAILNDPTLMSYCNDKINELTRKR